MKTKLKLFQARVVCAMAVRLNLTLACITSAAAFSDANWISMNPSIPGVDGFVYAAVVDGSGNLYIGGDFTVVGDVAARSIAKWDGSKWSALGSDLGVPSQFVIGPRVYAMAVSGNDLYVAGQFTTAGGSAATNVAKWNGSSWSALGLGVGDEFQEVRALAVSGSDVYAGGYFTTAGGGAATNIAKWNGSSWSALDSGMGGPPNFYGSVRALAVSGSDVYAGGYFTTAGGNAATNIAKWNGSSWSALGAGVGGSVWALAVSGSDLYAGGEFATAGGTSAKNIAKWNGSSWSALGSGMNSTFTTPFVNTLAVSGSDLYAGGSFRVASGVAANLVAKWDGSNWSPLGSGMNDSVYNEVRALAVSGSDLYAGGDFKAAGGTAAKAIAKWNGSSWSALASGSGMNGGVWALAVSGNDVYAGGDFTAVGGTAANYIAKWNGSSWSALGAGLGGAEYPDVWVLALAVSGSYVYAGGVFTNAGGSAANYIAKWNGSNWSALESGMSGGDSRNVLALAVSGSNLYAGGTFTNAGGIAASNIAKWNGSSWSALGSGIGRSDGLAFFVSALAVSGDGVYVGGRFRTAGGIAANNIAKWDGSSWSALGSGVGGFSRHVSALAVSGNDLYAGDTYGTVAKWNGSSWSELGGIDHSVWSLAVSGSTLYAGGGLGFEHYSRSNYIAKWDGTSWSPLGSGIGGSNPYVFALAVSGNDLYAGGQFSTAGGKISAYIARAYLLDLPGLSVRRSGTDVEVSWPLADTAGFALEQAGALSAPASWVPNTASVTDDGTNKSVRIPATNNAQIFRLREAVKGVLSAVTARQAWADSMI